MANFLPKIEYDPGSGPVTVEFDLPPEGDNLRERERSNIRQSISTGGVVQNQFNFIEQQIRPRFVFLTNAKIAELRTFFETHALEGKEFKYFEHKDEVTFLTVTLARFEFRPARISSDNSGGFLHDLEIAMRRTL